VSHRARENSKGMPAQFSLPVRLTSFKALAVPSRNGHGRVSITPPISAARLKKKLRNHLGPAALPTGGTQKFGENDAQIPGWPDDTICSGNYSNIPHSQRRGRCTTRN
jgi:hypothetical protein